ncbi:hypothetical protein [Chromobacterium vaccinii]|uniref:hypothetical protein n=1 Tax=Chromobacterium vaccinii TaxID=1108595 RepID=UPI001184865F|nr:hypothetical protein [Chromobacterium vaccinii]
MLGTRTVVHFSGIHPDRWRDPFKKNAVLPDVSLALPAHVATLEEFKVGTLWRDGRCISRPNIGSPKIFRIDASQAREVALEEVVDVGGASIDTVLPDSYFNLANTRQALATSRYVMVPTIEDRGPQWLLIPSIELIRFYFGISSRFLAATLSGRLGDYIDWSRSKMDGVWPILQVKEVISRSEAAVLARAIASDPFRAALLGVRQRLTATYTNNQTLPLDQQNPLDIQASFPLRGETTLRVWGKRVLLSSGEGNGQWAKFVMEIEHCSRPLEFANLLWKSDKPWEAKVVEGGEPVRIRPPHFHPLLPDDGEEDELLVDDVPADGRLARLAVLKYGSRFAGFDTVKFHHERPQVPAIASEPGADIGVPVDALTQNEGQNGQDAQGNLGLSEFLSDDGRVDRDLSLFLAALAALKTRTRARGWDIATRPGRESIRSGEDWVTYFPEPIGSRKAWHLIGASGTEQRRRQLVCAEIMVSAEGPYFYLLEMELKPTEQPSQCTLLVNTPDFQWMDEATLLALLQLTVSRGRWPNPKNKWKKEADFLRAQALFTKIYVHGLRHPDSSSEDGLKPGPWSGLMLGQIDSVFPDFSEEEAGPVSMVQ